jgi:hypothetical protein
MTNLHWTWPDCSWFSIYSRGINRQVPFRISVPNTWRKYWNWTVFTKRPNLVNYSKKKLKKATLPQNSQNCLWPPIRKYHISKSLIKSCKIILWDFDELEVSRDARVEQGVVYFLPSISFFNSHLNKFHFLVQKGSVSISHIGLNAIWNLFFFLLGNFDSSFYFQHKLCSWLSKRRNYFFFGALQNSINFYTKHAYFGMFFLRDMERKLCRFESHTHNNFTEALYPATSRLPSRNVYRDKFLENDL